MTATARPKTGRPSATEQELLDGLQEDLAAEYSAIVMYTTYAAEVDGIHRRELREFFQAEIADEQRHAQFLADKIVYMGHVPTTKATAVPAAKTNKERLEAALAAEEDTIARYQTRIEQAERAGRTALKVELEDLLTDETKHRDEMRLMLRNYKGD